MYTVKQAAPEDHLLIRREECKETIESYSGTFSPVFTVCLAETQESNLFLNLMFNCTQVWMERKWISTFQGEEVEPSVPFVTSHLHTFICWRPNESKIWWYIMNGLAWYFHDFVWAIREKKPISHFDFQTTTFCTEDCRSLGHRNQFQSRQDTLCLAAPADTLQHRRPD